MVLCAPVLVLFQIIDTNPVFSFVFVLRIQAFSGWTVSPTDTGVHCESVGCG